MKTIYCLIALFTGITFFGCDNENAPGGQEPGEEKAWVSFSISLPKTVGTKAADTNDANAEVVETEIHSVDVWLQNAGTNSSYTQITSLDKSHFTKSGTTYTAAAVLVAGTAGDPNRNIFVAINAPVYDPNVAFSSDEIYTMNSLADIKRLYSTTANEGFVMFNAEEVKAKLYATEAEANTNTNHTVVKVERVVGKVMLTYNDTKLFKSGDQEDQSGGGKFKQNTLKCQLRNANKKFYLIKKADYKDPNYTFVSGPTNGFADNYIKEPYSSTWMDIPANSTAPATGYDAGGNALVHYFPENTNGYYVEDNTTHLAVQAAFVPNALVTDYEKPDSPTDNTSASVATFYYNVTNRKYYSKDAYDNAIANNAAVAGDFWGPYTDGICYYYVPVGTGDLSTEAMLGAKRNHFYKMKINSMTAPGNPTPGTVDPQVDPENPVIKPSVWIAVEVQVEPWQDANAEVDLK